LEGRWGCVKTHSAYSKTKFNFKAGAEVLHTLKDVPHLVGHLKLNFVVILLSLLFTQPHLVP
jgi:hypothetical protein